MENYYKGKNVEETLDKSKIPIPNLPNNFIWMNVTGGSKMRNLLGYATKELKSENVRQMVWSGSNGGFGKAISCAEICKRNEKLHQITKICYRTVEEYWEPQVKELETLVVKREVPVVHILLSKDLLDVNEPGYQGPGNYDKFWQSTTTNVTDHKRKAVPPSHNKNTTSQSRKDSFARTKRRQNKFEQLSCKEDETKFLKPEEL